MKPASSQRYEDQATLQLLHDLTSQLGEEEVARLFANLQTREGKANVLFQDSCLLLVFANGTWIQQGKDKVNLEIFEDEHQHFVLVAHDSAHDLVTYQDIRPEVKLTRKPGNIKSWTWMGVEMKDYTSQTMPFAAKFKTKEDASKFEVAYGQACRHNEEATVKGHGLDSLAQQLKEAEATRTGSFIPAAETFNSAKPFTFSFDPAGTGSPQQNPFKFSAGSVSPLLGPAVSSSLPPATVSLSSPQLSASKAAPVPAPGSPARPQVSAGASKIGEDAHHENPEEECTQEYAPVVKLSATAVDNGEKDETVFYKTDCILFRFSNEDKEWKERGRGEVRLLENSKTKRIRMVLRENKTFKLRLNQYVHPSVELKPQGDKKKAWTWVGQDYGENEEGALQAFAIKLQTVEAAAEFKENVERARDLNRAAEQASPSKSGGANAASTNANGRGNANAAASNSPVVKPATGSPSIQPFSFTTAVSTSTSSPFLGPASGTSVAPAASSSDAHQEVFEEDCSAEYEPVQRLTAQHVDNGEGDETPFWTGDCRLYRFNHEEAAWGERGRGELKLMRNVKDGRVRIIFRQEKTLKLRLNHFLNPKLELKKQGEKAWTWVAVDFADDAEQQEQTFSVKFSSVETTEAFKVKFDQGRAANKAPKDAASANSPQKPQKEVQPVTKDQSAKDQSTKDQSAKSKESTNVDPNPFTFDSPSTTSFSGPFTFDFAGSNSSFNPSAPFNFAAPADTSSVPPKLDFGFRGEGVDHALARNQLSQAPQPQEKSPVVKAKAGESASVKSPVIKAHAAATTTSKGHEEEEEGHEGTAHEEECNAQYEAAVSLARVDVDNGERDEDIYWKGFCKLYRMVDGEWKEKGRGDLKLLQNRASGAIRCVLREDKTLKLRMNHYVEPAMALRVQSDTAWTWVTKDYAEEGGVDEIFSAKFANKALAEEFKEKHDQARAINKTRGGQGGALAEPISGSSAKPVSTQAPSTPAPAAGPGVAAGTGSPVPRNLFGGDSNPTSTFSFGNFNFPNDPNANANGNSTGSQPFSLAPPAAPKEEKKEKEKEQAKEKEKEAPSKPKVEKEEVVELDEHAKNSLSPAYHLAELESALGPRSDDVWRALADPRRTPDDEFKKHATKTFSESPDSEETVKHWSLVRNKAMHHFMAALTLLGSSVEQKFRQRALPQIAIVLRASQGTPSAIKDARSAMKTLRAYTSKVDDLKNYIDKFAEPNIQ